MREREVKEEANEGGGERTSHVVASLVLSSDLFLLITYFEISLILKFCRANQTDKHS